MRTWRILFLRLQVSEKTLLVVFALLIVMVWGWSFAGRAFRFKQAVHRTSLELAEQKQWLDNRAMIEAAATKTATRLDPTRTLDGTGLLAAIGSMGTQAGLRIASSGEPRNESSGQFIVHTIEFRIDKAEWESLKKFYLALQARSPYIGIESCTLQPDRANPSLTTASMRVSAPEVVR
jgi:hypothetical protein